MYSVNFILPLYFFPANAPGELMSPLSGPNKEWKLGERQLLLATGRAAEGQKKAALHDDKTKRRFRLLPK